MNLVIGIPSAGDPAQPFVASLQKLTLPDAVTGFGSVTVTGNYVPAQRELLVRHALRVKGDFLLLIDDDIVLPADALVKLLSVFENDPGSGGLGLWRMRAELDYVIED